MFVAGAAERNFWPRILRLALLQKMTRCNTGLSLPIVEIVANIQIRKEKICFECLADVPQGVLAECRQNATTRRFAVTYRQCESSVALSLSLRASSKRVSRYWQNYFAVNGFKMGAVRLVSSVESAKIKRARFRICRHFGYPAALRLPIPKLDAFWQQYSSMIFRRDL